MSVIDIAGKITEARRLLREFKGDEYQAFLKPHIDDFRRVMAVRNRPAIETLLMMLKVAKQEHAEDFGELAMVLMAVCAEVIDQDMVAR
jgi:hypothetical protein